MDSLFSLINTKAVKLTDVIIPNQPFFQGCDYALMAWIQCAVLLALLFIIVLSPRKLCKKNLASKKLWRQIVGALIEWNPKFFLIFILLISPLSIGLSLILSPKDIVPCLNFLFLNFLTCVILKMCRRLADVLNLRKEETRVTWCYVTILAVIGLWVIAFILIFNVNEHGRIATAIAIIGSMMGWIFQEKIKGVVAFLHLRSHHLLNVGDWIQIDKLGVDGTVQRMTLTSVTIYNWDTTTSIIPTSALQSEHFINLQNMMKGKTYGRRMFKTFVLDTGWFRTLTEDEINYLQKKIDSRNEIEFNSNEQKHDSPLMNLSADEIKEGVLNAQLYRLYIYHWLMNNKHVSQQPHLIVRWMDQKDSGMPLQVYAFIVDSSLAAFDWQESQIIEHIIKSMDWFGLRLYQSPSSYDVSNSNVYLTKESASYYKKIKVNLDNNSTNADRKEESK